MKRDNRIKQFIMAVFAVCIATGIYGCNKYDGVKEYQTDSCFEYHFYPEDYEEEYSETKESIVIEADKEYLIYMEASCSEGTMRIEILRDGKAVKAYHVSKDTPCQETIMVPSDTAETVDVLIDIEDDTKGSIIGEIKVG